MTAGQIIVLCVSVFALIVGAILIWKEYDSNVTLDDLITKNRTKHKNKIAKELAKFKQKPDFILCKQYYLEAHGNGIIIPEIRGVPVIYGNVWGKPYVFVWLSEFDRETNEQCEKILKEQKK